MTSTKPDQRRVETYALASLLMAHEYDYSITEEGKPGWHGCRCGGWQGYWCRFYDHVAEAIIAGGFSKAP